MSPFMAAELLLTFTQRIKYEREETIVPPRPREDTPEEGEI